MSEAPCLGRTIGILGHPWRATVTSAGDIELWDGSPALRWSIAADDRWHFPAEEVTVRQESLRGTPVLETRVRIPNGDVVQRIWSAPSRDARSAILVEFVNESPMPIAIALSRQDVCTPRAFHSMDASNGNIRPWPSADRGIERPAMLIPLGHRAMIRVGLSMSGGVAGEELESLPDWVTVVNGWIKLTERASNVGIPTLFDGTTVDDGVRALRCEMALDPPTSRGEDPCAVLWWMIAQRERQRLGLEDIDVPEVVTVLELVMRRIRRDKAIDWPASQCVRIGAQLLAQSDSRASADFARVLQRVVSRLSGKDRTTKDLAQLLLSIPGPTMSDVIRWNDIRIDVIAAVEREVAVWSASNEALLMPRGFTPELLGVNFEAHRIAVGPEHDVSLAVRWHGQRPAVIWEVAGPPGFILRSGFDPVWSSREATGEALWVSQVDDMASTVG